MNETDHMKIDALTTRLAAAEERAEIAELGNEALLAEVREWVCGKCLYVYPGPPQPGVKCVLCPRCNGNTMPKTTYERILLERTVREQREALEQANLALIEARNPGIDMEAVKRQRSAQSAALDAAWDAAWDAALDAALALVRDLISPEQFDILYGPWASVFGVADERTEP